MQADDQQTEVLLREDFGRAGCDKVLELAAESDLHARKYNSGTSTVLVVSKAPLPNYRADLDPKAQDTHQVGACLAKSGPSKFMQGQNLHLSQ